MKKKIVFLTNREYIKKYYPDFVSDIDDDCPCNYGLTDYCVGTRCTECWDLPAKIKYSGKYVAKVVKI